jgi:GNAT superfamily N-acetyltransferase
MIKIRKAKASDILQLEKLFLITRRQTFKWENPDKFKLDDYEKATVGEIVFVAENENNKILGFISVWDKESPPFIHHLFVSSNHQREGIGMLLIRSLFDWLPLPYRLKCVARNTKAVAFYQKNGWVEVERGLSKEGEYLLLELTKGMAKSD